MDSRSVITMSSHAHRSSLIQVYVPDILNGDPVPADALFGDVSRFSNYSHVTAS